MHDLKRGIYVLFWAGLVLGDGMDMDMPEPVEFHPVNPQLKSFHWILTLLVLLIIPSFAAVFAHAKKTHWAVVLQFFAAIYSCFESLFLAFPDPEGHENKTSLGTSWFLTLLLAATVLWGTFLNGSNYFVNRFYPQYKDLVSEHRWPAAVYRFLATISVLTGWVRVCLAPIALFGFCYGKHTGQCIAHGIMGLAFIGYGFVLALVLTLPWIRKRALERPGRSQEFYDSLLMCLWGIVNTFTEHRWGTEGWLHGDYQHTAMGIIWWCGGLLGMWLSRGNNVRLFVPSVLLVFTGWAMSEHSQHLEISTKVHAMFGLALMLGGVTRVLEILFILRDQGCLPDGRIASFQYFPPFFLVLSGTLFMSATEEQLILVRDLGADHGAYIMVVSGAAFMIFLWMVVLLNTYLRLVGCDENGPLRADVEREVQEFELGDLSDDEETRLREGDE